jgi:hypothetical protein
MRTERKYLVVPGRVRSQNDGDEHFIGAARLMTLYGVEPNECVIAPENREGWRAPGHLIVLAPRYDGDYSIPTPGAPDA